MPASGGTCESLDRALEHAATTTRRARPMPRRENMPAVDTSIAEDAAEELVESLAAGADALRGLGLVAALEEGADAALGLAELVEVGGPVVFDQALDARRAEVADAGARAVFRHQRVEQAGDLVAAVGERRELQHLGLGQILEGALAGDVAGGGDDGAEAE